MALSPEEETPVERMSLSRVDRLLRGPISEVITCAECGTSPQDQREPEGSQGQTAAQTYPRLRVLVCPRYPRPDPLPHPDQGQAAKTVALRSRRTA